MAHKIFKKPWVVLLLLCLFCEAFAQETINITSFGGSPNSYSDVIPAINRALGYCKGKKNITIQFPKGRYDFFPREGSSNTVGISVYKQNGVTIDGGDSEFIFHGKMQIANVDSSTNIALRNFTVDWDRPFTSQCQVVGVTDTYLDVKIDREAYPYQIEKDTILFTGEGWKLPVLKMYGTLYDKLNKEIVYNTWDAPLGNIFQNKAEQLAGGVVRFHGKPSIKPEIGTYVALFHIRYGNVGIHIQNSKDVLLQDVKIYYTLGFGLRGERTENITMRNASICVNDQKGRVFSCTADATNFVNCKGVIKVENCAHTGQGDDFINIHGRNMAITKIAGPNTLEFKDARLTTVGDSVWFINKTTAQRGEIRVVSSVKKNKDNYALTFTSPVPANVNAGDFAENKTWTAGLELRRCKILKRNRARGLLVTTPKRVVIEDNYFRSAGTAILIEGDLNFWFEAGATTNLQIKNNVFENCLTSGNKNGNRGEWGEAVITITPSHQPQNSSTEPYHKNIRITNNQFKVFDAPLVRAVSVKGLYFDNNRVIKTDKYAPYTWQKSAFLLDGCREVEITRNKLDDKYTTRDIAITHMENTDIKVPDGLFKVNPNATR
ncbi:hypothetical protein [uncultured Mucilaginibacter sp.]|uniref:alpha-1,3-galactosidase-related protein n=1 Tax=uncultured Mucilaginibacter sp. TaxID=797541 RepID=UPI0025F5283F|nr:hypothetical protein [uncultured Mucilaginibacter sp.]